MSYESTVLADSPKGYWRLGEVAAVLAVDSSGNLQTGEYKNSPTEGEPGAINGDSNTAVKFNGTSQYVIVPDSATMDLGDVFTYEAWIQRTTKGATDALLDKGPNAPILRFNGSDKILLRRNSVGDIVTSTTTITNDGKWHHVVATKNGATVKLYIDGTDVTGTITNQTCTNTAVALSLGASEAGAEDWFHGLLDEMAVYGTALSKERVEAHYKAGASKTVEGKAALTGTGTLTASGTRSRLSGPISLTGTGTLTASGTVQSQSTFVVPVQPPPELISLMAIAEGGKGRGFDLTDEVEGLQFSNVNPGGDEVCAFMLNREWFAENPEVGKGNLLRVIAGIDVLWQGRIEEIDRATGDSESLAVTAYGLGNRLSDTTFREIYIDRDLGKWGDASAQRRINVIASGATPERSLVVEQNASGLQSLSMTVTGLIDDTEADAVYNDGGIKVARLRVSEVTRLVFAADENLSATPRAWQTDAAGEEIKGEDYKSASSIDFNPSTAAPFIVLNWRFTAATALERGSTMLGFRYGGVRVFGTHGLTAVGTAPLDGFSADQIIGHILSKTSGIVARIISTFSYVIPQFTVDTPTTPKDGIASVDAFANADYGVFGPDSPLDNSTDGYFDYKEKDPATQHWFATRSDFDSDLNFHTETQTLFDTVDVSWTDEAGVSHVKRFSIESPDLQAAGLSPRVYPLDAGTTTEAGATIFAELFLNVFAGFAPARGSGSILGQIRHYRRGKLPAYYARADGSNIRIPDILPAETAFALDSTPDRRTIFPIKRVNVDLSGDAPKTTIEFDQTNDSLAMLLAQQATQAALVG